VVSGFALSGSEMTLDIFGIFDDFEVMILIDFERLYGSMVVLPQLGKDGSSILLCSYSMFHVS